ncbi:hypothetical protein LCGC14_0888500 [marine sediment metagenome]|uniref:Uncharacterized protein n=1 Tax=marine sediment metagenome TaxID=412755 RepID=A0A0F9PKM9_9ZZZZ
MASMARYLGRMVIPKLIKKGYNTVAIGRYLRKTTGTWRRATMLVDIREAKGLITFGKKVQGLSLKSAIPKNLMVETELRGIHKYRVIGMSKKVHVVTGHVKYEMLSIYSTRLKTKEGWSQEFIEKQPLTGSDPEYLVEEVDIFGIEHQEGSRY